MKERQYGLIEKVKRKLSPSLTEAEIEERKSLAIGIAKKFQLDPDWQKWITGIYLFGSTVYGKPKRISDIDLAIITEQSFFFGLDFAWMTKRLQESVQKYCQELGGSRIEINCTVVPRKLLENPSREWGESAFEVFNEINQRGVCIFDVNR